MGRKKRKSSSNPKKQTQTENEPEDLKNAPHSFVFHRGSVADAVVDLTKDFRKVMEPFTATSLKARKANSIKDFLSVAGVLHVSHMSIFTSTELGTYMKVTRIPRGPTLYFQVENFCLARDVISSLKKQLVFVKQYEHAPLVILNNFNAEVVHLKLMASMLQNMFPSINLTKVNLNNIRRCVLFNYNMESELIDVRHYAIKVVPVGVSKGVKKIVQSKVPNLSKFDDISDFITKSHLLSDSEVEDDPNSHVTLPQQLASRGNAALSQSSVRLVELGPRMTLKLLKIEDGFLAGEVLYHRNIVKTEEEKAAILRNRLEKRRKKEERKRIQAEMVRKKEKLKDEHKKKSLEGMRRAKGDEKVDNEENEEDDAEWYRQEVGEEPEHDLFAKKPAGVKRKAPSFVKEVRKKRKVQNGQVDKAPKKENRWKVKNMKKRK